MKHIVNIEGNGSVPDNAIYIGSRTLHKPQLLDNGTGIKTLSSVEVLVHTYEYTDETVKGDSNE